MKRVLLISASEKGDGGISRWSDYIYNYFLQKQDFKIDFIRLHPFKFYSKTDKIIKDLFYYIYIVTKCFLQMLLKKTDVVHISTSAHLGLFRDIFILYTAKLFMIKRKVIHFHFGRLPYLAKIKNWEWKLIVRISKIADVIIVMDNESYKSLNEHCFCNLVLVPNPISSQLCELSDRYLYENKRMRNKKNILFVGHVIESKGIIELVWAFRHFNDYNLYIIGACSDNMKEEIKKNAGTEDILERIHFLGVLPFVDVIKWMTTSGIFVLPSYTEGFPNVIIEALMCSVPIITTNVGAIPEILENIHLKEALIPPKNESLLINSINFYRNNYSFVLNIFEQERANSCDKYSIDRICSQLCKCWFSSVI